MAKTIKLQQDVIDLITQGTWSIEERGTYANQPMLKMPLTNDRKLYEAAAKLLKAMGGVWTRGLQATLFPDGDAEAAVREACITGEYVDAKQLFQFFETPEAVAQLMIDQLQLPKGECTVLEPSAGHGALIMAVAMASRGDVHAKLTAVEVDSKKAPQLRRLTGSPEQVTERVVIGDFLSMHPTDGDALGYFDRVIMNPPFSSQQDTDHVLHAAQFLKPGGRLVAVMSTSWQYRENLRSKKFRTWLAATCRETTVTDIPEGSFRSSGTNVRTVMVTIQKLSQ